MPTDIMSSSYCAERFDKRLKKTNDAEVKSGFLGMLGPGGMRQDVRVVVYKTSLENFAVIYPRKRLSHALGVVNLRNTSVERAVTITGFIVRQTEYDNTISAKFMCSERDVESWIAAFTSKTSQCHRYSSLPALLEAEES